MRMRLRIEWVFGALLVAGCATSPSYPTQANGVETYLDVLRVSMDWSVPGLAKTKAALDAGNSQSACAELLDFYRNRTGPRFFFGTDDIPEIVAAIREDLPDAEAELIKHAEYAVARQFPNSTARTILHRVELPENFSWTGNPTDDPEFRHMLQRARFWQDLGFAYALTGDERYAEAFAAQASSWLRDVPLPPPGHRKPVSPWWRTINAGIRGDTWLWAYTLFLHSPAMTPELHAQILGALAEHGRVLRHHHKSPTGNWCVMEMQGLLNIAVLFPEFSEARAWQEYARTMLVTCIERQVRPDGVQLEQSPNYHKGCIRWFLEPMMLAERNGVAFPPEYRENLEKMGEFAVWATDPQGRTVALSDSDREIQTRMTLTSLAGVVDRPDFAWYRDVSHWHYWLFGVEEAQRLHDVPQVSPGQSMRVFPDAGYVFGRSDWSRDARYFVFDCGPRGRGHGHLDLLSIEMHGFGDLLIADPGRWLYGGDTLRRQLVSTPAHNTISLDGRSHSTVEDPRGGAYELLRAETRDGWMYVHGRHRAYRAMAGPPVIERRIWFDGDALWLVLDSVQAPEMHDIRQTWQFATVGASLDGHSAIAKGSSGATVHLAVSDAPGQRVFLEKSVMSPIYGMQHPADRLVVERPAANARMAAALTARPADAANPILSVTLSEGDPRGAVNVTVRVDASEAHFTVTPNAWDVRHGK